MLFFLRRLNKNRQHCASSNMQPVKRTLSDRALRFHCTDQLYVLYLADCLDSSLTQLVETCLYNFMAFLYSCQGWLLAAEQHSVLLTCL